jgi:hypothetical protein
MLAFGGSGVFDISSCNMNAGEKRSRHEHCSQAQANDRRRNPMRKEQPNTALSGHLWQVF